MHYILGIIPLATVNIWHAYLLLSYRGDSRTDTISEHAAQDLPTLKLHRLFHITMSVCLTVFAVSCLILNRSLILPAMVLIAGAVFDIVEVMTLNKETSHHPFEAGPHQITSWLMALSYLIYGILITRAAGLPLWVTNIVWISFLVILFISIMCRFKRFWIAQMFYFALLALIVITAHINLLAA